MKHIAEGMSARDVRLLQSVDLCENGLATRVLHLACEMACHNILAPRFEGDDTSVGIRNDIWFWGDAEPRELLHAEAVITRVDGRLVIFNVTARAGTREIARGIHERMLVSKQRFMNSLPKPPTV